MKNEVLLAAASFHLQAELVRQRNVVADFRVRIERQVKRIEIEVVLDQQCDAPPARADDARIFAAPEIAVMHEHCVRACGVDRCRV